MREIKIPGVDVAICSLKEGLLATYSLTDAQGKENKRLVATEFNVSCVVRESDSIDDCIEQCYKALGVKVFEKYLEDISVEKIIISIRSESWDNAFVFTETSSQEDKENNILGLLHGIFSITPVNSKEYNVEITRAGKRTTNA